MKKNRREPVRLNPNAFIVDTHCHLDMSQYADDIDNILDKARTNNIQFVITIGIDEKSSRRAIELSIDHEMVYAAVGIHPHDVEHKSSTGLMKSMARLAEENRSQVVAYGEIGLDYFKKHSSPETQREFFSNQLALAKELHLPVIVHDREAHEDTLSILKQFSPFDHGGVLHCFSGKLEYAKQIIDLGFHISIPGIITFKNSQDLQEVATEIPLSSMLLETDGPFLAPSPWRGKRNEPSFILYTAEKIAQLRNIDLNELADRTTRNAQSLFHLPHPSNT